MKLTNDKGEQVEITWGDHRPGCEKCREVDLSKPSTLANSCAQGAPLILEEPAKRQAPVENKKRKEIKQWAEDRGVFVISRTKNRATKYVGDS